MSEANSIRDRFNLAGKVAIITGASRGIGEAMARGMGEFGAKVVVSSRSQESVDAVAKDLGERGIEAMGIAAHAGREDELKALVDKTVKAWGGVDIVVNNAATNPVFGPSAELDEGAFNKIMVTNVYAPLALARAALPSMQQRGGGSVINIASIGGVTPEPMLAAYSASKAALISITKATAKEWGPDNVRVNAILPGLIKTKFARALWENEEMANEMIRMQAVKRLGVPDDIAGLAVFLASDAAAFCSGGLYVDDGGATI